MGHGPDAEGREGQGRALGSDVVDRVACVLGRKILSRHKQMGELDQQGHVLEVAFRLIGYVVQVGIDGERVVGCRHDRVAIRPGRHQSLHSDVGVSTGPIIHHDRLIQDFGQFDGDDAGRHVAPTTGCERHQPAKGAAGRLLLPMGLAKAGAECGHGPEDGTTRNLRST
jgi:hypothetical protein